MKSPPSLQDSVPAVHLDPDALRPTPIEKTRRMTAQAISSSRVESPIGDWVGGVCFTAPMLSQSILTRRGERLLRADARVQPVRSRGRVVLGPGGRLLPARDHE